MSKKYIIWGSGGHAKVLASLIADQGGVVAALFDNNSNATTALKNTPLFIGEQGFNEWSSQNNPAEFHGLVAIGGSYGADRLKIQQLFSQSGVKLKPIIHNQASVCSTASIGDGSQILAQAVVATEAIIGNACILNHKSSVDHECVLGNGVHLAPSATLCGLVELSDNVMIGANAVVLPRIKIGANTIVGAGAVVTKDLPANVIVAGNPAKIIKIMN